MMIRMFDSDRDGTIGFEEFCGLWGFLAAWRSLFDRFDADRSGNISLDEYTNALVAFGYRCKCGSLQRRWCMSATTTCIAVAPRLTVHLVSPQFIKMLFRTFDKRNENAISFDLFVQSCISLKRMTDVFKKYDDDRDGFITLSLYVSRNVAESRALADIFTVKTSSRRLSSRICDARASEYYGKWYNIGCKHWVKMARQRNRQSGKGWL